MLYYATLFDINYLSRGLCLLSSLQKYSSCPFKLFVLSLDEKVIAYFTKYPSPDVILITLNELENKYPALHTVKPGRSKAEYIFTLSPFLPSYILDHYQDVQRITTLDADILFYSDPITIFEDQADASVLITPHNFPAHLKDLERSGRYNVSFQSFKRDRIGLACLAEWKEKCIEWCYDYFDMKNNRYADQKYLDHWLMTYPHVEPIHTPGTGVAPWNIAGKMISQADGTFYIDNISFIYYHFHGLRIIGDFFAVSNLEGYGADSKDRGIQALYHHYLLSIKEASAKIKGQETSISRGSLPAQNLLKRLLATNGYWLYTRRFIVYLNLFKHLYKIKKLAKRWLS